MRTESEIGTAGTMNRPRLVRTIFGWGIHFYTSLGLVCAAGMAVAIVQGGPAAFRWAFVLMFVATVIDATDGTLARAVRIKEAVPHFDGRRLDDIVDFMTYTALPLLLVWRAGILPEGQEAWLLAPLIASAYGFCQTFAKTEDGFFLGFPSYWNLVALYLYLLHYYVVSLPGWLAIVLVLVPAVLTFVPTRYLYPSHRGRLNMVTNVFGVIWGVLLMWVLYQLPTEPSAAGPNGVTRWLIVLSLLFPLYYLGASWAISMRLWSLQRRSRQADRFSLQD